MICTKHRLNGETERIKKISLDNGYPKNVINPTNPSYRKFGTFRTCQYAVLPKIRYLGRARGMQLKITTNHG